MKIKYKNNPIWNRNAIYSNKIERKVRQKMIELSLNETLDWEFEVLDDPIEMNIHLQSSREELCCSILHNKI
jgi:hypothetical protein